MEKQHQTLIQKVREYYPEADLSCINQAYQIACEKYGSADLDAFLHAFDVAGGLVNMRMDVESIAAGLLHDLVESRMISPQTIEENFGDGMLNLLDGVTQLNTVSTKDNRNKQAEKVRRMFLAIANDIRVIFIKLVDRVHTMRDIEKRVANNRKAYSQESIDIYAPIASRLGIYTIKKELEDLSFQYLFPKKICQYQ